MFTPYEPEYMWIRKDQYSPAFGENLLTRGKSQEQKELEGRLAKIERRDEKEGPAPQMTYPSQMTYLHSYGLSVTYSFERLQLSIPQR